MVLFCELVLSFEKVVFLSLNVLYFMFYVSKFLDFLVNLLFFILVVIIVILLSCWVIGWEFLLGKKLILFVWILRWLVIFDNKIIRLWLFRFCMLVFSIIVFSIVCILGR